MCFFSYGFVCEILPYYLQLMMIAMKVMPPGGKRRRNSGPNLIVNQMTQHGGNVKRSKYSLVDFDIIDMFRGKEG